MHPASPTVATPQPAQLQRRLGLGDATVIGLGSMIGAGVFAAFSPAAAVAGDRLLIGLAVAAVVAYCNATSSAQLAARFPEAGGTYVYGRRCLGPIWGAVAGWGFVVGKTASCAAMALTVGNYLAPSAARPIAVAAIACLTAVNLAGVHKTARLTAAIVTVTLSVLAIVIAAGTTVTDTTGFADGAATHTSATTDPGVFGILQSAGLLFFAFAGYARIATLGEEVRDPERTIPKAVPIALGVALCVYGAVGWSALRAVRAESLAATTAPLEAVVSTRGWTWAEPVVRVGAGIAALGVLLSLIAGVSRTMFAMARNGDLPRRLNAVHPRSGVPHRAELVVAAVAIAVVTVADVRGAIGFSSCAVLFYYAVANASALTLEAPHRRSPRALSAIGAIGCVVLAATLPRQSLIAGVAVLSIGAVIYAVRHRQQREPAA